jgi:hypothetical protein
MGFVTIDLTCDKHNDKYRVGFYSFYLMNRTINGKKHITADSKKY